MKKKLPHFKNDKEMVEFTDKNDLGDYLEAKDLKVWKLEGPLSKPILSRLEIQNSNYKIDERENERERLPKL